MTPANSPRFNYRKNLERPVELRLVRDDDHHYVLQFKVIGRTPFRLWHKVRQYTPTNSPSYRPGTPASSVYGKWHEICFYAATKAEGEAHLETVRERFRTVNDLFDTFVKEGLELQKRDLDRYLEYRKKSALPRVFR
jgi:hypothetical protein